MFGPARRRLAVRYALVVAVVLAAFSLVFLAAMFLVLRPDFDPKEAPESAAAQAANVRILERVGLAIILADGIAVLTVGLAGYYLAGRTLGPIRDAHERQGRFVSDASHEIRTPLAVIRSNVDRALTARADEATKTEALHAIGRAATRLGDVASDLLVLARIEARPIGSEPVSVDASVVVAEVVESAVSAHPEERHRLVPSLQPGVVVVAQEGDLARIVGNLVDNAFAHGKGRIDVRTGTFGGQAVIEVCDAGPGIPEDEVGRLFEPFYRVRADADAPPGSGLGLAIVDRLVGRLGGSITVRSAPGTGTCFRVLIPRVR
jgi:two-component system, OmpR family, sensor kinase